MLVLWGVCGSGEFGATCGDEAVACAGGVLTDPERVEGSVGEVEPDFDGFVGDGIEGGGSFPAELGFGGVSGGGF